MSLKKIAFCLAAASIALPLGANAEEIIWSNISPDTHYDNTFTMPEFSKRISEGTNGEQSLSIHGGGVLAGGNAIFEAIGTGAVDMGNVVYAYTPSLAPALTLIGDMPGQILQVSAAAATETMLLDCPECIANMDNVGVRVLGENSTESFRLICKDKEIVNPEDAQGVKLRAVGAMARNGAELGMTPVTLPYEEIYEALQRGQVDCVATGPASFASIQLYDVGTSVTKDLPLGTIHGYSLLTINKELWDSFTPEQKKVWYDASAHAIVDNSKVTLKNAADALVVSEKEKGIKMVSASDALKAKQADILKAQAASAIETARERGVKDPEAIAQAFEKNVEKWTAIYNEIGDGDWNDDQWAQYAGKLKSEIYDKLSVD